MFAAVIAVPAIAFWKFGLPEIPAFWFAYIVTRPLGASFADWMGVSHERGGLDWGTGPVSLALAIIICFRSVLGLWGPPPRVARKRIIGRLIAWSSLPKCKPQD